MDYEDILSKAEQLQDCIQAHPRTIRYRRALDLLKSDESAREIYARLVSLGKKIAGSDELTPDEQADTLEEYRSFRATVEEKPIVTEFVDAQKDYFELVSAVNAKMKLLG